MGALREWLTSVVVVSVLLAVVQTLIPEGTVRKIGAFTGGLILLVTLLQPLLGVDFEDLELRLEQSRETVEQRQQELEQAGERELAELIERQTAAYIWDKADALGLDLSAEVRVERGPDGIPLPVSATLTGTYSEALSAYLERELGIPRERQVWHEGEN